MISLNFYQLKREADFRFSLVRIRENAEAIAFYRGEIQESRRIGHYSNEAFNNFSKLIRAQLNLASSTTLISTGHRPSINKFYSQVLELSSHRK